MRSKQSKEHLRERDRERATVLSDSSPTFVGGGSTLPQNNSPINAAFLSGISSSTHSNNKGKAKKSQMMRIGNT